MKAYYIAILFFSAIVCYSQETTAFNFQSVLFDEEGVLVALTPVALHASILDPAGQVQYQEDHQTTTNSNGYFSINIGRGAATGGEFDSLSWRDTHYFLQLEWDRDGQSVVIGDIELLSVPYALIANHADIVEIPGPDGEMGDTGAQGDPGAPGRPGSCGPQGPQPPQGPTGVMGPTGEQGPTGISGEMVLPKASTPPADAVTGMIYVDDGSNTDTGNIGLRYYDGTKWIDI